MSFSKARIQRFNELTSEAPPPGAYDPKFQRKVKGTVIEKTGRFHDAKSTTSSGADCNASVSSRGTTNASVKVFKTPQIPKKRVISKAITMSCPNPKSKVYNESKEQVQYEPSQELADLRVECINKDKTIQEYEKHIEDMKAEIINLTDKLKNLEKSHSQIIEQHQKDVESMAILQQEIIDSKNEKYNCEIQNLNSRLTLSLQMKDEEIEERNKIEGDLRNIINNLETELLKYNKQDTAHKMMELENATKKLDKITGELNDALNLKDLQMTDLLTLQSETENKLNLVQNDLKKSEQQIADLEANLININNDNTAQDSLINQQILQEMTNVLQEYFDYDNYDGKWNIENMSFHPDIENFLVQVRKFVTDLKVTYEQEIELSRDNFNEERENLEQELERKQALILDLENKLSETNETNSFLTEELQDVQKLYKDMNRNMHEIKAELEVANEKYTKALAAHKTELELTTKIHEKEQTKLKDLLEEARNEYLKELDNMTTARNEELYEVKRAMEKRIEDEKKRMKECTNKMVENAEAVTRETLKACRAESEERVRRAIAEADAKISLLTRETKNATEEELRQVTEKYKISLEELENEKAILNTKLAQRDLEVIQLTAGLEEMKCTAETQESFSQSLQSELDRAEAELVEKKEELRNLKDQIRTESAEMVARRRRFEVVMAENQASVAALTRRLAQSETEVERLQKELQTKEGSLIGFRELIDNITHNSKSVQERLDNITEKLDEKVEFINQLELKNLTELNTAKSVFNDKINSLKSSTIDELTKAQDECKSQSEKNTELKSSLHQMSKRLCEVTDMLLKLEEVNDEQLIEISKLQLQITKNQKELDEKNKQLEENKLCFEIENQEHKTEINEMNEHLSKLKREMKVLEEEKNAAVEKKYDLEELNLKYNDELTSLKENLNIEKTERAKLQQQTDEYQQTCKRLTEECEKATDKYTELMNCDSRNQRIKYISQLKDKISTQEKDLLRLQQEHDTFNDLIDELRQQNEKLKLDERRQIGLGKENIHSLSSPHKSLFPKSANSTPISSPLKPLTPFRDRND